MSGPILFAVPVSEYRDAMGPVLLWRFPLTGDVPRIGRPSWEDVPSKTTHFTAIPVPQLVQTR